MGKYRNFVLVAMFISFIVLLGCSNKTAKEQELEKQVEELQKELAAQQEKEIEKETDEEVPIEEEKPAQIEVIDPNTKEVVKMFKPEEMGFGTDNELYEAELKSWAKELARGTETTEGYDQRMIPDKLGPDGEIIKGSPRVILDEAELVEKVVAASEKGGVVELPLYITESGYNPEEVTQLNEVVVASYTTYFDTSVAGRSKNIELSAEAINNVIVGVGDIFSFNTTVGPSDAEHGYQKAMEAVNGKLVEGIGGGICQTSSTLFNAVDHLAVDYVEKHHHSVSVGYVPNGRDATVSYGGLDFRFQNTTNVPLLLKAVINGGALTVEVRTSKANQSQL